MYLFGGRGGGDSGLSPELQCLQSADSISVRQRINKCEILTCNCFESGNKYDVYQGRNKIFYAHETTGCCVRQWQNCFPECASWELSIDHVGGQDEAFKMTKPCTPCTFLCINRPVTKVTDADGNVLGSIRDPCACIPTNMTFDVQDETGEPLLHARSGCCQWGICCPMPCGPCRTVEFPVYDLDGTEVAMMQKRMKGCMKMFCCSMCFDDVENYKVSFSDVKDARTKALLMALAIFTDYRYFSNTDTEDAAAAAE